MRNQTDGQSPPASPQRRGGVGFRIEPRAVWANAAAHDSVPWARPKAAIARLEAAARVIRWTPALPDAGLLRRLDTLAPSAVRLSTASLNLRVRHVRKSSAHYYLLFNEGESDLETKLELLVEGRRSLLDPCTESVVPLPAEEPLQLPRHALRVLRVERG